MAAFLFWGVKCLRASAQNSFVMLALRRVSPKSIQGSHPFQVSIGLYSFMVGDSVLNF